MHELSFSCLQLASERRLAATICEEITPTMRILILVLLAFTILVLDLNLQSV